MNNFVEKKEAKCCGVKFFIYDKEIEIARAYLYFLYNDLHERPFALLEDVRVCDDFQKKGYGTKIVIAAIDEARRVGCYKIIATSRHSRLKVHGLYERLGFNHHGLEFRLYF